MNGKLHYNSSNKERNMWQQHHHRDKIGVNKDWMSELSVDKVAFIKCRIRMRTMLTDAIKWSGVEKGSGGKEHSSNKI